MSIKKLPQDVINKIAAGEILQRPSNAIKQLIQNSVDAEATAIKIFMKQGGLKQIKISDNGTGIALQDFPLVCERFATSKISSIQDLKEINSFGFRGQALASLSYVSDVQIISKKKGALEAWKANYKNGKIIGKCDPHYLNQGTTIICKDMFGQMQIRKQSLRINQEKRIIIDLIQSMSLHLSAIKFRLQSQKGLEYSNEGMTCGKNILADKTKIYQKIFQIQPNSYFTLNKVINQIHIDMILSKILTVKQKTIHLFINNRRVQQPQIQKGIQNAYAACYKCIHQSKVTFAVYLSLQINPKYLDCNVHPTKKMVFFNNSGKVVEQLKLLIQENLKKQSAIKKLTANTNTIFEQLKQTGKINQKSKNQYDYQKNRNDTKQIPLDYYIPKTNNQFSKFPASQAIQQYNIKQNEIKKIQYYSQQNQLIEQEIFAQLKQKIQIIYPFKKQSDFDGDLITRQFFRNLSYVGYLNLNYIMIQYNNKMYLLNLIVFLPDILKGYFLAKQKQLQFFNLPILFNLKDQLKKLKQQESLVFDLQKYLDILFRYKNIIEKNYKISLNQNLQVITAPIPFLLLKQQFKTKQLAFFLLKIAKQLEINVTDILQSDLLRFLTSYFQNNKNIVKQYNQAIRQLIQSQLIPIAKIKTKFHKIQLSKYIAQIIDLKDLYKIFERC